MAPKRDAMKNANGTDVQSTNVTPQQPPLPHQDAPPPPSKKVTKKPNAPPKKKGERAAKKMDKEQSGEGKKLKPISYPLASQVKKTLMEMFPDNSIKNVNETKQVCEAFLHTIVDNVMKGNNVALINYMTFKRVLRDARTHCNPQTGEPIQVDKHYVMAVDIKKDLKQQFKCIPVENDNKEPK